MGAKCDRVTDEHRVLLKRRVDALDRKIVAAAAGMTYNFLSQRLCGFYPLTIQCADRIQSAIDAVRAVEGSKPRRAK